MKRDLLLHLTILYSYYLYTLGNIVTNLTIFTLGIIVTNLTIFTLRTIVTNLTIFTLETIVTNLTILKWEQGWSRGGRGWLGRPGVAESPRRTLSEGSKVQITCAPRF